MIFSNPNNKTMEEQEQFFRGQKVWCYYHYTMLFKPPMCGEILFKLPYRKKHHFANKDGKCLWYFTLMKNGLIVLMPEVCIHDLEEEVQKHDKQKCPRGIEQLDSWMTLNKWQTDRIRYLND